MLDNLGSFRLSHLQRVIENVIGFASMPDTQHTADNQAWLRSMLDDVNSSVFACLERSDMDRKKLLEIRAECTSLLNVIFANAWKQPTEPPEIRRLYGLIHDVENARSDIKPNPRKMTTLVARSELINKGKKKVC